MRTLITAGTVLAVSLPVVAAAQPPPPPPAIEYAPAEPKMRIDVALIAALPQGDFENADTSPGLSATFGYTVAPNISLLGGLRFISLQANGEDTDFTQTDLMLGGRYSAVVSPSARVFGEAMLLITSVSFQDDSESGVGIGLRGGAVFPVSGNISIGGALSYTTSDVDGLDAAWFGLEGFVSFAF